MPFTNQDIKSYVNATKLRIIAAQYFFYDKRRQLIYDGFAKNGRLSIGKIDSYLSKRGITRSQNEIERALDYIFSIPFASGRFNYRNFPACYTAKERQTCIEEKLNQLKSTKTKGYECVIFSVLITGRLADLRKPIAEGRWTMPDEHAPCQAIGEKAKKDRLDGIAAPSTRAPGGNCCAIFTRSALKPGAIVGRETIKV